jgi:RHS repeat-associated protein
VVYVHAGQQVIADYARGTAAASPGYRYVYADYVDEPILRHTGTGTTLPTTGHNALYFHRNQQYSIIGLTNAAGTLVERYSYTAYGTIGIYDASGTVRTNSTYANRYTYTGREYDPDLNLYHFRARWYDPSTGGFISRDPLGYVDGLSLYRGYFGGKGVDPYGNWIMDTRWIGSSGCFEYCYSVNHNAEICSAFCGHASTWPPVSAWPEGREKDCHMVLYGEYVGDTFPDELKWNEPADACQCVSKYKAANVPGCKVHILRPPSPGGGSRPGDTDVDKPCEFGAVAVMRYRADCEGPHCANSECYEYLMWDCTSVPQRRDENPRYVWQQREKKYSKCKGCDD